MIIPILFSVLFILLMIMIQTLLSSGGEDQALTEEDKRMAHYALFLPSSEYYFFSEIRRGATEAAEAFGDAVSFHAIDSSDRSFEFSLVSGFDGIAVYPTNQMHPVNEQINRILETDMPLVFIENVPTDIASSYFVGSSGYDTGRGIAKLVSQLGPGPHDILLLYSLKNPGYISDSRLLEMGMTELLAGNLGTLNRLESGLNPLDAERLTYDALRNGLSGDVIVLTDVSDTLVTAQTIIDMNMVGQVQLIGFGDNEVIRDYIDKGILLGSIVRNPYRIGFSTMLALHELSQNGYTSAYVDTGVSILGAGGVVTSVRDYQGGFIQ